MSSNVVATGASSSVNHRPIATFCKSTTTTRARDAFNNAHSVVNLPTTTTSMAFVFRNRQMVCNSAGSRISVVTGEQGKVGEEEEEEEDQELMMVGRRVRVKVPLKVYHVPRVPEFDLAGLEGTIKQFVGVWKEMMCSFDKPINIFQK
ncbi:hypothetical protein K2173_008987 [Erythroxylum novogranatense]|uniref:Ferredoxin thioredoxin reductase alpha chain domain-containing protein n=1 Tax=Erythroxylum novogranatense TaxID=1862640 RepID=A0AAV8TVI6_9ROSI|nr:hypothetical protein K2173_008987 [Erythroxylum novogranatense]